VAKCITANALKSSRSGNCQMKLAITVKCASSAEEVCWFKHLLDVKCS